MGLLDGDIKSLFGTVMGSFYLSGTLTRVAVSYDNYGGTTETPTTQSVKVQENMISEELRATGNFSQNEKQFIILQKGVTGGIDGDDKLTIGGVTYALREPEQDPAKSYWLVRGVPV